MNKIISFSEYREIYITPSQKIFDPEDFYDNDNPDWDFFVNTEQAYQFFLLPALFVQVRHSI